VDARRFDLALDEARRALDQQVNDVARIRDRTTNLVMVGGLAAAFIGGLAIRDDAPLTVLTVLGAVAFTTLLAVAVAVLLPRRFVFTQHAQVLVSWAEKPDATAERMERSLALHMDGHYRGNARRLNRMTVLYGIGLTLLLVEVVLLLFDLRGR
jgi:hypothetical protein